MSLLEVVGVGLINCEEVGFVRRPPHLLVGGVRSVTTVLKEVEEEHQGAAASDIEELMTSPRDVV